MQARKLDRRITIQRATITRDREEARAMRLRFSRTRNFTPPEDRRITVKYRADQEYTVKREWGEAMVSDGDGIEIDPPARDPLDHDNNGRKGGAKTSAEA